MEAVEDITCNQFVFAGLSKSSSSRFDLGYGMAGKGRKFKRKKTISIFSKLNFTFY